MTSPELDGANPADHALDWILTCLKLRWRPSPSAVRPKNPADAFWEAVKALAPEHRVAGLLYRQALTHPTLFPKELARWLGWVHTARLLRFEHWHDEVCQVLEALIGAQVPVIVLKGWAFIATLYEGDPGQRPVTDLDLLVPAGEVDRVQSVLASLNYPMISSEPWPGFSQRYSYDMAYRRPSDGKPPFHVDLHWRLLIVPYYERIPIEDWFVRAQPARVAGVEALVPAPEDHLVYLCGHLALHHRYSPALFRYHDMAVLIHHTGDVLDWDAVVQRAVDWRLVIPLQRTLARLGELWPETVPAGVAQEVAGLQPTRAERWIHEWVVGRPPNPTSDALLSLATMPGLGRRVRFVLEQAFPSPAYMRQRYCPQRPGLWPLAYLQRASLGLQYLLRRLR
ncbi:MAG: nucleotidyltransferase family protein [Anaerolineae bacterium]